MWYKVKRILVGTNKVRPIPFTPSSDTICYYKFNWNMNDSSGNNKNLSIYSWTPTYWTESWWGKYIYFPNNCWTNYWNDTITYSNTTLSFWYKGTNWYDYKPIIEIWASWYDIYWRISWNIQFEYMTSRWGIPPTYSAWNNWHYYCVIRDSSNTSKIYVDWNTIPIWSWTGSWSGTREVRFRFNNYWDTDSSSNCNTWYLWEVIFEKKAWDITDMTNYFSKMRSDYWI